MFVVLSEIQGFGFAGDTLAWIVFELTALISFCHNAAFDAKELILVHLGRIGAVGARVGDFLSEQHSSCPLINF